MPKTTTTEITTIATGTTTITTAIATPTEIMGRRGKRTPIITTSPTTKTTGRETRATILPRNNPAAAKDAALVSVSAVPAVAHPVYFADWPAAEHAWNVAELTQRGWQNKLPRKIDYAHFAYHLLFLHRSACNFQSAKVFSSKMGLVMMLFRYKGYWRRSIANQQLFLPFGCRISLNIFLYKIL